MNKINMSINSTAAEGKTTVTLTADFEDLGSAVLFHSKIGEVCRGFVTTDKAKVVSREPEGGWTRKLLGSPVIGS